MKPLLMIDNYDSFTYNLVQYFQMLGEEVLVYRNDVIDVAGIEKIRPSKIVISPGPCTPNEAGISLEVIRAFSGRIPLLGVCLGHQAMGQVYGGKVVRAPQVMHGKTSLIYHQDSSIYRGLPNPFVATRYHSLIIERSSLPEELELTSWTEDGEIMGIHHKRQLVVGMQFHPESILTEKGLELLENFLKLC